MLAIFSKTMKANELRIGNFIRSKQTGYDVRFVSFYGLCNIENNPDEYEPIPLTGEILKKCGFESEHITYHYILIGDDALHVYYNNSGLHRYGVKYKYAYLTEIEYLHQLQNLYFALTGEELTVNL